MFSSDRFCQQLPFIVNGHFSIPEELYQAKLGSCETSSFVNITYSAAAQMRSAELFLALPGTIPVDQKKYPTAQYSQSSWPHVPGCSMALPGTIPEKFLNCECSQQLEWSLKKKCEKLNSNIFLYQIFLGPFHKIPQYHFQGKVSSYPVVDPEFPRWGGGARLHENERCGTKWGSAHP